mmetsp:Transcript_3213/g.4986  ORF Transcript_3213/g.4986 Transcript_3213/m.4986 type:complete len:85 (+) Transcript_3213:173-427(+)
MEESRYHPSVVHQVAMRRKAITPESNEARICAMVAMEWQDQIQKGGSPYDEGSAWKNMLQMQDIQSLLMQLNIGASESSPYPSF